MSSNSSSPVDSMAEDVLDSSSTSSTSSSSSCGSPYRPSQILIDEYQALLSNTLDLDELKLHGYLPTQPIQAISDNDRGDDEVHPDGRAMTKAEKQNAKKKRRREREREAKAQSGRVKTGHGQSNISETVGIAKGEPPTVAFRLFSSCPLSSVALAAREESYLTPSNPCHRPFTTTEASTRRHRAQVSAVNFSELGGPSTLAERWTKSSKVARAMTLERTYDATRHIREILVVQVDRRGGPGKLEASSRTVKTIPRVSCQAAQNKSVKRVRRSRRKRHQWNDNGHRTEETRQRGNASYFCPPDNLGGKSMSTLWGYGIGMEFSP